MCAFSEIPSFTCIAVGSANRFMLKCMYITTSTESHKQAEIHKICGTSPFLNVYAFSEIPSFA
ncbi:hypothetical protein HOLleu_06158 [Holothuria leucospilota]|uniref:Uncharacterized protein n=1 Tax=Holothuria leucospilota TaxID=206669 RepID=A0A9Q1CMF3_HOLLE|nr:hypothetical protein HOLleu_06158 [Holothuria leucospilota]